MGSFEVIEHTADVGIVARDGVEAVRRSALVPKLYPKCSPNEAGWIFNLGAELAEHIRRKVICILNVREGRNKQLPFVSTPQILKPSLSPWALYRDFPELVFATVFVDRSINELAERGQSHNVWVLGHLPSVTPARRYSSSHTCP
jgi:hypothetical protein